MSRRFRSTRPLGRKAKKKDTKQKIIIVSEGKNTEPEYFKNFQAEYKSTLVELKIVGAAGDPKRIVEKAIDLKREEARNAKKSRNSFESNFSVWAVFDRDEHNYVSEAKQQAKDQGIRVIFSNPCFELWPILHYEYHAAPLHRHKMQKKLADLMDGYDPKRSKSLNYQELAGEYEHAKSRAKKLETEQTEAGSPDGNPVTNVYDLCDVIILNGKQSVK